MRAPNPTKSAPFLSAEAAWFWTAHALHADNSATSARIRVEIILRCIDTLYRQRRIELLHARILRIWGRRGVAPNPARMRERGDWRLWREALGHLEGPLRARGIVAEPNLAVVAAE